METTCMEYSNLVPTLTHHHLHTCCHNVSYGTLVYTCFLSEGIIYPITSRKITTVLNMHTKVSFQKFGLYLHGIWSRSLWVGQWPYTSLVPPTIWSRLLVAGIMMMLSLSTSRAVSSSLLNILLVLWLRSYVFSYHYLLSLVLDLLFGIFPSISLHWEHAPLSHGLISESKGMVSFYYPFQPS